jgi:6-phosphogluconate dehydrogenase
MPARGRRRAVATVTPATCDVGLVGLAVMGQNLALNMADHGYRVAVYNRTTAVTDKFIDDHKGLFSGATGGGLIPGHELVAFVGLIKRPRKIVMMVKAGGPTDAVIDGLTPLLEPGDILVDGGNAFWEDTIRREKALKAKGLRFIGSGVSGGEEGARFGPSLIPKPGSPWKGHRPASRLSPPAPSPARRTSGPTERAITSRWSTTALSTATCR